MEERIHRGHQQEEDGRTRRGRRALGRPPDPGAGRCGRGADRGRRRDRRLRRGGRAEGLLRPAGVRLLHHRGPRCGAGRRRPGRAGARERPNGAAVRAPTRIRGRASERRPGQRGAARPHISVRPGAGADGRGAAGGPGAAHEHRRDRRAAGVGVQAVAPRELRHPWPLEGRRPGALRGQLRAAARPPRRCRRARGRAPSAGDCRTRPGRCERGPDDHRRRRRRRRRSAAALRPAFVRCDHPGDGRRPRRRGRARGRGRSRAGRAGRFVEGEFQRGARARPFAAALVPRGSVRCTPPRGRDD